MPKSLTRVEFEQQLQTNVEFIAETRVSRLMELRLPELAIYPADVAELQDGTLALNPDRLRAYIGLVASEVLASFDAALLDIVYAEDEAHPGVMARWRYPSVQGESSDRSIILASVRLLTISPSCRGDGKT